MTALTLRRANVSRKGGHWNEDDFDVFAGEREVGRIYRVNAADEIWFWGVSFLLTNRKSYGHLDGAKAALGHGKAALDDARFHLRAFPTRGPAGQPQARPAPPRGRGFFCRGAVARAFKT